MRIKAGFQSTLMLVAVILLAGLALVSCSGRQDVPVKVTTLASADSIPRGNSTFANDFLLGPEDFLEIRYLGDSSLNIETEVRPDGTVSAPLLSESVNVFGMTPKDLERHLEANISDYLRNPKVFVNVKDVGSSSVFVLGEVRNPQIVADYPLTLSSVISKCGGLVRDSDSGQILVIRKWNQAEPMVFEVNFDALLDGKSMMPDLALQRYDIVVVPRNRISKVSEFIETFFEVSYAIPRFGIETAIFFDVLEGSYQSYAR